MRRGSSVSSALYSSDDVTSDESRVGDASGNSEHSKNEKMDRPDEKSTFGLNLLVSDNVLRYCVVVTKLNHIFSSPHHPQQFSLLPT